MKYKLAVFIAISVIWSGCATLPEPVDEVYLSEKTSEEAAKLDTIGADIIAKKKDKDKIEKDLEIAAQKMEASSKEISQIEAANALLVEKEKLYTLTGDNKLADIQKEKEKNNLKLVQAKAYLDYSIAKKDETEALLEVKKAGLAARVAEFDYEKALIAKAYQMKRSKEYGKNMINEIKYKKFMDDQKIKVEENQKSYEKTVKALGEAEDKLKKSGYEGEK